MKSIVFAENYLNIVGTNLMITKYTARNGTSWTKTHKIMFTIKDLCTKIESKIQNKIWYVTETPKKKKQKKVQNIFDSLLQTF